MGNGNGKCKIENGKWDMPTGLKQVKRYLSPHLCDTKLVPLGRGLGGCLYLSECLFQVSEYVVDVLNADREANG